MALNSTPRLTAALLAADLMANPGGRVSLYNLLNSVQASVFPARLPYMVVVTRWLHEDGASARHTLRTALLTPDREFVLAESHANFAIGGEVRVHMQADRILNTTLPAPGVYRLVVLLDGQPVEDLPLEVQQAPRDNLPVVPMEATA